MTTVLSTVVCSDTEDNKTLAETHRLILRKAAQMTPRGRGDLDRSLPKSCNLLWSALRTQTTTTVLFM